MAEKKFEGFYPQTFEFFENLANNNSKEFFDANREIYDNYIVTPSKSFVNSIAGFLEHLNPSIRREAKFNVTLMRISKDMRFAKTNPYKEYFLIHFGRFKMDSEFYLYLDKKGVSLGMFINNTKDKNLYFNHNLLNSDEDISAVCREYKINNKYGLHKINKNIEKIKEKFNFDKDKEILTSTKYILLENFFAKDKKFIYTPEVISRMIKMITELYPLYCHCISSTPNRLIEEFKEKF